MTIRYIKQLILVLLFTFFSILKVNSEIVKSIEIIGNERVSSETIKLFSKVNINETLDSNDLNDILKNLYDTNFFKDITLELVSNILKIKVDENPIIENINFNGIKSDTLKQEVTKNLKLKSRSSFNEILLNADKKTLKSSIKDAGYYFSKINIETIDLGDKKLDLTFNIELGNKAKIKRISFIGDKKFKDGKLKSLIISEEYRFWKFISGKKFLNENVIKFDERLLKNFYLNKGYYDVKINSSFAKLLNDDDEFELIFNINAKNKFFFGNLNIELPTDFETSNFDTLKSFFIELKDKPYSINKVEKILNRLDLISINQQYQSVKSIVSENIVSNVINLTFKIEETEKFLVERINIFGNNITRENVIRNQLLIDEGDLYNDILKNRSLNEIKSLNFFKSVKMDVVEGKDVNSKIININVEEKPTGEISAGAGFGTSGEVIEFGVRENNYLGKGLSLDSSLTLSSTKINGNFNVINPNYNNSDKSVTFGLQALENDRLSSFGYKSSKYGTSLGTNFEYLEDFNLGVSTSAFLEKISTSSAASVRQRSQAGNYFDNYANLRFDYDKRNQKYKTTEGFRSVYDLGLPLISDKNTMTNKYNYKYFSELYENNVSTFSFGLSSATSLTNDDIKLSERLYVPQRKLRGFENGKIGPKDGTDFIGGNYYATMNFTSTLPQILPNAQNIEVVSFLDVVNLWGVDNNSLDDGSKIRSSIGLGIDWFTPVGPLNFSLSHPISKSSTDLTERFRFNLGTTF
ncbi:outer membrane protein assembly factor BamA [Candidatus Pelagibacter ubique]|uniref:outer membrane protein assembly factor BamA n=1 Tax=Pelagibacter ubique TaxID=198252 RepID=UPI0003C7FE5F